MPANGLLITKVLFNWEI